MARRLLSQISSARAKHQEGYRSECKPTYNRFRVIRSPKWPTNLLDARNSLRVPRGIIEFVVDGEEGIRLSDALKGNWVGFEGRDETLPCLEEVAVFIFSSDYT